jgi:hypothetical protein
MRVRATIKNVVGAILATPFAHFKFLQSSVFALASIPATGYLLSAVETPLPFSTDTNQILERTCFQTGKEWSPQGNLGSNVAIVYGIDTNLPARIETWREHGYRIHVMTGVAWGQYQDYL